MAVPINGGSSKNRNTIQGPLIGTIFRFQATPSGTPPPPSGTGKFPGHISRRAFASGGGKGSISRRRIG